MRNELDYTLSKFAEECGELVQKIMKVQIYGAHGIDPKTGMSNKDNMQKEMGDMLACLQSTCNLVGINITPEFIAERAEVLRTNYIKSQVR